VSDQEFSEAMNAAGDGWLKAMGVRWVRVTLDEVICEWEVDSRHHQAYGIVHGGVHCGVIESVASVGAAVNAMSRGQSVVGLENHTSFIRAVRSGKLRARGAPITRGRSTQVWEGVITDEEGRIVARGTVRLLCLDAQAPLAGGAATPKGGG
jgi:uncharacterized protein (TIGR00369 family)